MKHAFMAINGREFPAPKKGLKIKIMTTVSDGRSEQNIFIGQRIGRDLQKIENIEWPYLSAELWNTVLQCLSSFVFNVTYCDPVTNEWVTRKMYISDRECEPFRVDPVTGKTILYKSCKCSMVETGG